MDALKIGVMYTPLPRNVHPLDMAQVVEDLGFDSYWMGEHFTNWNPVYSALVCLSMFAARTQRITLGSSVILLPLRHPVALAKDLSTLDILSGGRLIIGVGAGGDNPREFEACGVPLKERGPRASEAIQVMKKLWSEPQVDFQGRFFQLRGATMDPKPLQKGGPPIWVGGRREGAMRRTARYGDGWLPYLYTPDQYRESVRKIAGYAHEVGRDPASITYGLFVFVCVAERKDEARAVAAQRLGCMYSQDFTKLVDKYCLLGTPDDCVARFQEYADAGVRYVVLVPTCPAADVLRQLQVCAAEIAPRLRALQV
ncbi:MAG: LLM class flavin-dependent oxidoreductase [Chloroflexi bacterium]|nr:LLM class flavin-dependent oxidoreductase [Chloroflexota bacterium]